MKLLAPLRGVTIRKFRQVFATQIAEAGFDGAVSPFVSAMSGVDPLADREIKPAGGAEPVALTPQFIGKDPAALRFCLERIKSAGRQTANLNCGCPFPMVRNKGRGSGLLRNPAVLEEMVATGCETMGPGNFSVKARLGIERSDELLKLMPVLNRYPLGYLAVHARTAKQMYGGEPDLAAFEAVRKAAAMRIVYNGDYDEHHPQTDVADVMIGRPFVVALGRWADSSSLVLEYMRQSAAELCGERPVLGRIKELVSYWREIPRWRNRWTLVKTASSLAELSLAVS